MHGKLIRCSCGRLYEMFNMYAGDQSVCPSCRAELAAEYSRQTGGNRHHEATEAP